MFNTFIKHLMCDENCDFLKKIVQGMHDMVHDIFVRERETIFDGESYFKSSRNVNGYVHDFEMVEIFEEKFVAHIPHHRPKCIEDSLNIVFDTSVEEQDGHPTSYTLIKHAFMNYMLHFASKLFEYGAKSYNVKIGGPRTMGGSIIVDMYMCNSPHLEKFVEIGPKTYAHHIFLKTIIRELDAVSVCFVVCSPHHIYPFLGEENIFELLIESGTNLDYVSYSYGFLHFTLINIIKLSRDYPRRITYLNKTLDKFLPRYDFPMNYTDQDGEIVNVSERVERMKNQGEYDVALCNRVMNYYYRRYIMETINKNLPLPIAEEISEFY